MWHTSTEIKVVLRHTIDIPVCWISFRAASFSKTIPSHTFHRALTSSYPSPPEERVPLKRREPLKTPVPLSHIAKATCDEKQHLVITGVIFNPCPKSALFRKSPPPPKKPPNNVVSDTIQKMIGLICCLKGRNDSAHHFTFVVGASTCHRTWLSLLNKTGSLKWI